MDAIYRSIKRIGVLAGAYSDCVSSDEVSCIATDLVADVLHWSRANGVSVDYVISTAQKHYLEERAIGGDAPHEEAGASRSTSDIPSEFEAMLQEQSNIAEDELVSFFDLLGFLDDLS